MKIGLNATCINDRPSGARQRFIGIYGELIARLPDADFIIYDPIDCPVSSWFSAAPNVSTRRTPIPSEGRTRKFVRGLGYWRSNLQAEELDIFEMFSLPFVKAPTGRTLLTIHDIRSVRPGSAMLASTLYNKALAKSLRSADHVITVSAAMKEELLGVYPDVNISVIYNGLNALEYQAVSEQELLLTRQKHKLPQEFVLSVGHFEERKNYLRLIDAIAHLRDRGRSCTLVIVGNDSGYMNAVKNRIHTAKLDGSVQILSGLSDLEVRCLYKLCSLFIFPSAYEGFGIPILESMAAGCPMVLSDIPVFREITQGKGVYFPHDDIDSMANAIDHVLSSSSERKRIVEYGHQRIQAFNFRSLGAQLESIYRLLM